MIDLEEIVKFSKKTRLLYVEDDHDVRKSMLVVLEEFFDHIVVAKDGEEGVRKFEEEQIDLVITDILMPKLNGIEMAKKIRAKDRKIPILIVTAYNETEYLLEGITLHVDGYILKPIDLNQFTDVIANTISKLKLLERARRSEHLLRQYQEVADTSSIVSKTDLNGIITYVNDNFSRISGYSKEELLGRNHNIVRHPDVPKSFYHDMWKTIRDEKKIWHGVIRNRTKNNKSYYVKSTIKPILDIDGNIIEYFALRDEITDIMNPKKQLDDALRNLSEPIVIYMKLDDFTTLEEFFSNDEIEKIQENVVRHLEMHMPDACGFEKVYQLGNGEFAMVQELQSCQYEKESLVGRLRLFQEAIKKSKMEVFGFHYDLSIMMAIVYEGSNILESAKLGIKELMKRKQDFIIANHYAQMRKDKANRNMKTLMMVKKAIAYNRIISYFQPIVDNRTQKVVKYESLVRLVDEKGEVLSPFYFLETAKKGKYYAQITQMVVENSFNALRSTDLDISINLSVLDIENESFRNYFLLLLQAHKEDAHRIVIELLEDKDIKNFKIIRRFIKNIKSYGVKIAIDDFGSGYSNFERLLDYQPDILKIDGSLVRNIAYNSYSRSVVKTIVMFAKEQNIELVAEFVENKEIYDVLCGLGVEYSQGYYFGKPTPMLHKKYDFQPDKHTAVLPH